MSTEVSYRQLFCRLDKCRAMFFICRPCYRGQVYCSEACRSVSRREQRKKANRRYQQDAEVRQDHRDRMRERRNRDRGTCVIDQSSALDYSSGSICALQAAIGKKPPATEALHEERKRLWPERVGQIVCAICGRLGRWVAARIRRE